MEGKIAVSLFFIVIIAIFAYYILVIQPKSFVNPIDPNDEYADYLKSENTDTIIYDVIGEIAEVSREELTLKTSERDLTIKIPEATTYNALIPPTQHDETDIKQNELVRATLNVSKSTNEIIALTVTVVGTFKDGKLSRHP